MEFSSFGEHCICYTRHCFFGSYFPQPSQVCGQLIFHSKYSSLVISPDFSSSIRTPILSENHSELHSQTTYRQGHGQASYHCHLYNVVKYYNKYELKKASKEKREPVLIHQFSSHVMRHTGCTNMARSGVNIKAAQYIMGHAKSDITLDVYNHLNNRYDAKAEIEKLEKMV